MSEAVKRNTLTEATEINAESSHKDTRCEKWMTSLLQIIKHKWHNENHCLQYCCAAQNSYQFLVYSHLLLWDRTI